MLDFLRWIRPAPRAAALALLAAAVAPGLARAQEPAATLTLEEAISLARRHNPTYLAQRNDEAEAEWSVREAYGALIPTSAASLGFQYQAKGSPRFGVFTAQDIGFDETPDYLSSDYSLGLNLRLSGASLFRLGQEKATQRATYARVEAADFALVAEVTRQYLAVLRAQDAVDLARQELERASENLKLAAARVAVGAAIPLEEKQLQVERGRAEVALIQAEGQVRTEKLRLVQQLGIELDRDVRLTTGFEVFEPRWELPDLVSMAASGHPQLRALRAGVQAGEAAMRMARSSYLPILDLSAGWGGYTREVGDPDYLITQAQAQANQQVAGCQLLNDVFQRLQDPLPPVDCVAQFAFTDEDEQALLAQNDVFPFDFTKQPMYLQARVSIPIFSGFARQRQVESARVATEDARHRLRGEELRLKTDVGAAYEALRTAYRSVRLEERTRELGEDQLRLARERYRVGAASALELMEAETLKARADRAYLSSVYAFHEALALLEAAVGRQLRPGEESGS